MQDHISTRWISMNDVCRLTSLSRTTINSFRADPKSGFPVPLEATDGARRVCFIRAEIENWMEGRERKRPPVDRLGAHGSLECGQRNAANSAA
ncbi:MAG: AlpA family phage regulatory protein [Mesorhizobium sp.]|nr:AlpA family phage regulatory protein [Mesorhizobium sp.]